jgi:hypothetical protein
MPGRGVVIDALVIQPAMMFKPQDSKGTKHMSTPANQLAVQNELSSTAQTVQDESGNQTQLYVTGGGNIGIGTSNPQQPLHVGQYQAGVNSIGMIRIAHTGNNGTTFKSWDLGIANPSAGSNDPDAFSFYCVENNVIGIVMASNGAVGVNNPNPQQALDVNGTVKATGLQISGSITLNAPVLTGLQPTSAAPPGANLESVFVDTNTGNLYYQ